MSNNNTLSTLGSREIEAKPARMLLVILGAIPEDMVKVISARSINLRRYSKIPMVMLCIEAAIQVGLDLIFFKFGEALLG